MQFEQLGPYKIGKRIGRGGMGAVFEAVNAETGEAAAIKVLNPHLADDHGFRERFEIEIETLKKLRHPNIVRMYGYGEQEGYLYYAMELVKGRSVEEEIQGGKKFTWQEVVRHGINLLKALRHAHDNGVVHRDIKPANILIAADGEVKLTDFGIARLFGNTRLTMEGGLVGTAEFMSPEQAAGDRVTPQSDLYSVGGVMFAMLAGRPPFRTGSLGEMLHKQRFEEPPPVSRFAPDVPAELQEFIAMLLAKDPKSRGPNALILSRQLSAMEHGLSVVRSRPAPLESQPPQDEPKPNHTVTDHTAQGDQQVQTRFASTSASMVPVDPNSPTMDAPAPSVLPATPKPSPKPSQAPSVAPVAAITRKTGLAAEHDDGDFQSQEPARATLAESRFVTVEEDERRREELERETSHAPAIIQIVLLAVSLVAIVASGWYFTRPPTATHLLAQIETAAKSSDPDALLAVDDQVQAFLSRFPHDERAAEVRQYEDEIDLLRMEQRFRMKLRFLGGADELTPAERDYFEATSLESTDPQRASEKLAAIVELFGNSAETDGTAQVVEMARRQLKHLQEYLDKMLPQYQQIVDQHLQRAEKLRLSAPEEAKAIWRSIIKLYGEKSWAAEQVAKAKVALGE